MSRRPETLAAAIPAYQAGRSVGEVVRRTRALVPTVLVVDDGSLDDTAAAAERAGAEVVALATNRGKGHALRLAFDELFGRGFEAVVTLDADGQHLPEEIPRLVREWRAGADLVLGTRHHLFAQMRPLRRFANRASTRAISWLVGRPLDDVQTGFRLYSRRLYAVTGFPEPRYEAESAVVVRALRRGLVVATVAVRLGEADGAATSHYRRWVDSLRIARAVVRTRLERHRTCSRHGGTHAGLSSLYHSSGVGG